MNGPHVSTAAGTRPSSSRRKPGSSSERGACAQRAVEAVRPRVVRALERLAPARALGDGEAAMAADVHERTQHVVARACHDDRRAARVTGEVHARLRELPDVPGVLPRVAEDPLLLAAQDLGIRVPAVRERAAARRECTRARDGPLPAARAARAPRPAGARARSRPGAAARPRVRRLPHRPARRRRRAAASEAAARPRPPDRRASAGGRQRRLGVPWLGWTGGDVPLLPTGRENLCDAGALHRLRPRRRLRRVRRRRRALLLPDPGRLSATSRRRRSSAPGSSATARSASPATPSGSASTASARPRTSSRRLRATRAGALFAFVRARRRGRARVRARARLRLGRRVRRAPAARSSTRRSSSRRSARSSPRRSRALAKGGTVVCAGIHMSDIPSFPYELLWERARRPLRREPHAARRRRVPRARAAGAGAHGDRDVPARGCERGARPAAARRGSRRGRPAA